MKKIICIGSATKDIFLGVEAAGDVVDKICFELGRKVYTNNYREEVGGGAVNVGTSLRKLGYKSFVFARTDKSDAGKWIVKRVSKLKLKKNYMQQSGGESSQTSVVIFDEAKKDRVILRSGDSVENFNLEKAFKKFRESVDWIYVSSQKKNSMNNLDLVVAFALQKKAKVALNPSSYQIKNEKEELLKRLKNIEILFVNLGEGSRLTGQDISTVRSGNVDIQQFAKKVMDKLLKFGSKVVSVTDGDNGAWVGIKTKEGNKMYYLKIEDKEIVDTTGAGDAYASGFLASYMESEMNGKILLDERVQMASAAGFANGIAVISEIGATHGSLKASKLKKQTKKLAKKIIEIS